MLTIQAFLSGTMWSMSTSDAAVHVAPSYGLNQVPDVAAQVELWTTSVPSRSRTYSLHRRSAASSSVNQKSPPPRVMLTGCCKRLKWCPRWGTGRDRNCRRRLAWRQSSLRAVSGLRRRLGCPAVIHCQTWPGLEKEGGLVGEEGGHFTGVGIGAGAAFTVASRLRSPKTCVGACMFATGRRRRERRKCHSERW